MPKSLEYIPPKNNLPDCLYMNLTAVPVKNDESILKKIWQSPSEGIAELKLLLSILFNEQWVNMPMGRVKLGISSGELQLKLTNCTIPIATMELCQDLELSIEKNRQQTTGNNSNHSINVDISSANLKAGLSESAENKRTDNFHFNSCQVTVKGEPTNPSWVFEVQTGEPILKGRLAEATLGTLTGTNRIDKSWHIDATFKTTMRSIQVTGGEGLWLSSLSPNKSAVLDRALAKALLQKKIQPYISRVEFQYV